MIDFTLVRNKEKSYRELLGHYTVAELKQLTNEMIDLQLSLIADSSDADVVFVPSDPIANDTFADNAEVVNLPWTLGHVVVHVALGLAQRFADFGVTRHMNDRARLVAGKPADGASRGSLSKGTA